MNQPQPVLILVRDLLMASKVTAAAAGMNVPYRHIRDAAKLQDECEGRRLIVDLTQEGFLDAAARWKQRTGGYVTGFAGHTETELLSEAREKGVDQVLARGAFVNMLPSILRSVT